MKYLAIVVCVFLLPLTPVTWAQTSEDDSLADNQPADNVRGGAVQERAPGRWVDSARGRHMELRNARLAAQRSGDTSELAPVDPTSFGSSGGATDLISTLLGGFSSDLIGSLLGGTSSTGSTGSTGGAFSDLPPEVLQMLAGAGIDVNELNSLNRKSSNDSGTATQQSKDALRTQSTNGTEEPDFVVRWADAMLSTLFTSLAVAVQTTDFIDLLKDLFRPVFNLEDPDPEKSTRRLERPRNLNALGGGWGSGPCHRLC
jgi:hypothetical protein